MLRSVQKLYIWVIRLFKKRMSNKEVYSELLELRNEVFDNISNHILKPDFKGYLSCNINKDTGIIEYNVGQYKFLLQAEIQFYSTRILYKVYSRKLDLTYYPNSIRYIQEHISTLNLISSIGGKHEFESPKSVSSNDFIRFKGKITIKEFPIAHFGEYLLDQSEEWLITQ